MNRRENVIDYTHYEHLQFEIINSNSTAILMLPFGPALFLLCYPAYMIIGAVLLIAFLFFSFLLFKNKPKSEEIDHYIFRKPKTLVKLDNELDYYDKKIDYFNKFGYILLAISAIGLPIIAAIVYFTLNNIHLMNILLAVALVISGALISLLYMNLKKREVLRKIKTKLLS